MSEKEYNPRYATAGSEFFRAHQVKSAFHQNPIGPKQADLEQRLKLPSYRPRRVQYGLPGACWTMADSFL